MTLNAYRVKSRFYLSEPTVVWTCLMCSCSSVLWMNSCLRGSQAEPAGFFQQVLFMWLPCLVCLLFWFVWYAHIFKGWARSHQLHEGPSGDSSTPIDHVALSSFFHLLSSVFCLVLQCPWLLHTCMFPFLNCDEGSLWKVSTAFIFFCCFSFAQSCPTLCNPMDCSTPGFPVHHQLLELAQLMSIELVMPFNHLILCHPLFLLPSVFPGIRVFSSESTLCIR